MVRLTQRQVWYRKRPIYLLEMGFIIQPTTWGLLWCAVNIWVALPIKALAFFLCLIYCHSSSAQTASWNLCQSTNDIVFAILIIIFYLILRYLPALLLNPAKLNGMYSRKVFLLTVLYILLTHIIDISYSAVGDFHYLATKLISEQRYFWGIVLS